MADEKTNKLRGFVKLLAAENNRENIDAVELGAVNKLLGEGGVPKELKKRLLSRFSINPKAQVLDGFILDEGCELYSEYPEVAEGIAEVSTMKNRIPRGYKL